MDMYDDGFELDLESLQLMDVEQPLTGGCGFITCYLTPYTTDPTIQY